MNKLGDICLNSKWYKVKEGRSKDLVDFAPAGSASGTSRTASELGLYQPFQQTDWRHGFGWSWWGDDMGYQFTDGSIDTRQEGIVQMFTAPVASDNNNNAKRGFTTWNNATWAWGVGGLHKYKSATWEQTFFADTVDTHTVTLQPSVADTYINSNAATTNYGTANEIHAGESGTAAAVTRALLKFDLSTIPVDATVTSAVLTLNMTVENSTNARSIFVYRTKRAWNPGTANWNRYSTGNNWGTAGGFGTDDCEQTDIGSLGFSATEAVGLKAFTLTAAKIQEMAAGTFVNNGFMLKTDSESNDQYYFSSNESADTTLCPKLVIIYTTIAAGTTSAVNYALAAGDYLFYCPDGYRVRKVNKSDEHSQAGNDSDTTDFAWLVMHNGYVYGGKDGTNQVHRDSTSDLSDLEGTTADPDVIYVGLADDTYETIGGVSYAGNLYISRADGLWMVGEDLIARKVLDFSAEASPDNFRGMVVHNGYLLFPIRDRFYQWNGARLSDITPPRITDTFPYTTYGRFDNLTAVGKYMYCSARTNESTYNEDLICWDGVAWHKLARLATSTDTVTGMGYDAVNNYLWYHLQTASDVTYYIRFQDQSAFPYPTFATTGTHDIITSRLDMGFRRVIKSTPSILIEVSNVSATQYITVSRSIDGGAWATVGNVITNGMNEIILDEPIEYYQLRLKFTFVTATATSSPILESYTARFLMRPEEFYGWSYTIPIAKGQAVGINQQSRPVREIIQNLRDARNSKSPVEFIDEYGDEYKVYVTSLSTEIVEWDKDEGGVSPNVEKTITINLTEARQ